MIASLAANFLILELNDLASLNLHVTPMPPIRFRLNLTLFGRRCGLKNLNIATMAAILDTGTEQF